MPVTPLTPSSFTNEPLTDFSREENRRKMEEAIELVRALFGKRYQLVIGGERYSSAEFFPSLNPSRKGEVVGYFCKATEPQAEQAMQAALKAYETWKEVPADKRADLLFKSAAIMRRRRFELAAWMIHEVGKSWVEADADVAEAIDFCDFYAREMLRLAGDQPITRIPGERNELRYIPLGVGVVIPPWNFPLAILCGMTTAAVVAGNTVVLKPSSDAPAIAYRCLEVLEEAGLPPGVVNFLTGPGGAVGDYLVQHPRTRFVAFTGSKAVGLGINEKASRSAPGQIWIKRSILEMGGKDAILVADDADLDAAAEGVALSAFGFQGQKCSACSRAIVDDAVYDAFLEKLVTRTRSLSVGMPTDRSTFMGPVVNERAYKSILEYIEVGRSEGRIVSGGEPGPPDGWYVMPTIVADVKPGARLEQEEIFGPVLAVIRCRGFEDGLRIANDTEYGLTGAVYSRSEARLDEARRRFHVGNLYLNRKCTGALVGAHPFGGFNMSGTDSKAGGRDYLLLFTQAKAIAEKVS
ncbi:MAG TPA: L-glutamate gamma-semialdehyde dehydrogenase [Candidatus Polarisedimenticolia bacterium]|nr:L-glutamate gamma-semialdehyde dehydrogenase [Candidatus Polarisedimenticolia bacterium]